MWVDIINLPTLLLKLLTWSKDTKGRYICVSNVHMCMEVTQKNDFAKVVNHADMVVADGKPIYWALRWFGYQHATHIRGLDLTEAVLAFAEKHHLKIGFYGGSQVVIDTIKKVAATQYPKLNLSYAFSPPYRLLSDDENKQIIEDINQQQVDILLVGLGCPKQEQWMKQHHQQLGATLIGVGAVFDFLAGTKKIAPKWMQTAGLEWFYRLCQEPKRLAFRYLSTNPLYLALLCWQKMKGFKSVRND